MKQQIKLIVPRHGLLTSLTSLFILLQALLEIGLAFGVREFLSRFDLLTNSSIGFSLELVAAVKQVLKLMELITHPEALLARRSIASGQTNPPIRGHADTVKAVSAKVCKMSLPSLGRAIGSQLDFEDGRTMRLNRDQDGASDGKNLIAEINHHGLLWHREGGRDGASIGLEGFAEIAYGVWLVLEALENRGETRNRASCFQA